MPALKLGRSEGRLDGYAEVSRGHSSRSCSRRRTEQVERKLRRALVVGGDAVGVKLIRRAEMKQWTR
jgi:hypothetical protein